MAYPNRSDLKWFFGLIALSCYGGMAAIFLLAWVHIESWPGIARGFVGVVLITGAYAALCSALGALLKRKKAGLVIGAVIGLAIAIALLIGGAPHW